MKLTKQQREQLRMRFGGRCAYCGQALGNRWHADHVEPVMREWWEKNGGMQRPQHDHIDNLMPACGPCNLDKHAMTLEEWRRWLANKVAVLQRDSSTYRHAVRFGLVQETGAAVKFHFERVLLEARHEHTI